MKAVYNIILRLMITIIIIFFDFMSKHKNSDVKKGKRKAKLIKFDE